MPVVTLTDITVRSLKPAATQITYTDKSLRGFGCRVSASGMKSFVLVHGPERQRTTLGRFPVISLADARTEAKRILAQRTLGKFQPKPITWDDAVAAFLAFVQKNNKPRTHADYKRLLERHFPFGRRKLSEIRHEDITRKLDRLDHIPSEQYHALTVVKIFLAWTQKPPRRYIEHSPCEGMSIAKRPSCKRVLTSDELRTVWLAADEPSIFHRIVRLCILLGQRRCEITCIRAEYIDWHQRTITWPDTKNGRPHTIPFAPLAEGILRALPAKGFLFPGRYDDATTYTAWAQGKMELDQKYRGTVGPYTIKDLRRTAATNWAMLGVAPHVVERLLNHTLGSIVNQTNGVVSAVAEVYNRATYLPEMRAAIETWEAHLAALTEACNQRAA